MKCSCSVPGVKTEKFDPDDVEEKESDDPAIKDYKDALEKLTGVIKTASQSKDGQELSDEYWNEVSQLLKKAKLGISMHELGIDDEDENPESPGKDTKIKPMGDTRDGDEQFDTAEDEKDAEAADKEKESEKGNPTSPPPKGKTPPPSPPKGKHPVQNVPPKKDDSEDEDKKSTEPPQKVKEFLELVKEQDYYTKKRVKEFIELIKEKAVSRAQQKFFALVKAVQSGKRKASGRAKDAARDMDPKDVEDFASTKHKGLPDRVKPSSNEAVSPREKVISASQLISGLSKLAGYSYHNASVIGNDVVIEFMKDGVPVQFVINENIEYEEFGYSCILGKVGDDTLVESLNEFLTKHKLCILMEDDHENV